MLAWYIITAATCVDVNTCKLPLWCTSFRLKQAIISDGWLMHDWEGLAKLSLNSATQISHGHAELICYPDLALLSRRAA